ncbi:MAG: hypothetical protein JKY85_04585 [Porticoccus sp.]|nr:hypothetical protein [Porticoccus sp.]
MLKDKNAKIHAFEFSLYGEAEGMYAIEEKQLKILITANENLTVSFQLLKKEKKANEKDSYGLVIGLAGNEKTQTFVLFTTQSKEIRKFRDLDLGKKFIQNLIPEIKRFEIIIEPPLEN